MRKLLCACFISFFLCRMLYANDSSDLQKLQPLSKEEIKLYKDAKNDAAELHKFIVTRTYVRTINRIIPGVDEDLTDDQACKLPRIDKDVTLTYAINDREAVMFFMIVLKQSKCR